MANTAASPFATNTQSASNIEPTSAQQIDEQISRLKDNSEEFARLSPLEKANLLEETITSIVAVAPEWAEEGAKARGLTGNLRAEEWLVGPIATTRLARLLAGTLRTIHTQGKPPLGTKAVTRQDGRTQINVFPATKLEQAMFTSFSSHLLLQEGVDETQARASQASYYQQSNAKGAVSLILGAGNVSSIPPMDAFTKLFNEGAVTLIKMNPVNEWVGPILERALAPLVKRNFVRFVYGGAEQGKYCVEHATIDDVHITGSDKTFDAIVWGGTQEEQARRKAAKNPKLTKPISSELGNISPVVIVPAQYSPRQLWFQARNIASMVSNNGSFNCNAAKLIVTSSGWSQREEFIQLVVKALSLAPTRKAYYPGAFDRYETLTKGRSVTKIGAATEGKLPWALIRNVDSNNTEDPVFHMEPFCGVLSETTLSATEPDAFLAQATDFLNNRLWGTLNACIIVHPKHEKDPVIGKQLTTTIRELKYGSVAINHWPGLVYGLGSPTWGGHPSSTPHNIQSGLGWVHNSYMVEGIDKAVLRGNLTLMPYPVWFYDHKNPLRVAKKFLAMEASPSWTKFPGLALASL